MKIVVLLISLCFTLISFSQTKDSKDVVKKEKDVVKKENDDKTSAPTSNIEIIKDPRVDGLVRKQAFPLGPDGIAQIPGYRVQLVFDSDKKKVDEMRARFININSNVETYVVYNAPNYLLKAGDCRTYNDAEKIRDSVRKTFPGSFIVREMVKVPKLD